MNTAEIPEGTVTVLFTDLVESTRLNQLLGDEQARAVSRSIEGMARRLVEAHKGVLIKEMGDGLMAVFQSARRAVTAGREIQVEMRRMHQAGMDGQVEMRIGLHTGEVIAEDGDVHGETVIIAKRIEGLAPPGGVLASETVHGVLGTDQVGQPSAPSSRGLSVSSFIVQRSSFSSYTRYGITTNASRPSRKSFSLRVTRSQPRCSATAA